MPDRQTFLINAKVIFFCGFIYGTDTLRFARMIFFFVHCPRGFYSLPFFYRSERFTLIFAIIEAVILKFTTTTKI